MYDQEPEATETDKTVSSDTAPIEQNESPDQERQDTTNDRVIRAAVKVARGIDRFQRWRLESDEPDAAGRWDPKHRHKMLRYVWERDGGRCGLCGGEMKLKGAHVEHIVPKVFAVFDIHRGGKAVTGTAFKSRLHRIDNLQAAHTYCNRRKGNSTDIRKWRHPAMPLLAVAVADDGRELLLPWKSVEAPI